MKKKNRGKKLLLALAGIIGLVFISSAIINDAPLSVCIDCKIRGATIDPNVKISLPFMGDGWTSTVGNDDKLYMFYGDGTGESPLCLPIFAGVSYPKDADSCFVTPPEPDNIFESAFSGIPLYNNICDSTQDQFNLDCDDICFTETCPFTPQGLIVMTGHPLNFVQSGMNIIHIPYGDDRVLEKWDKSTGQVWVGDRLYNFGAYADDRGSIELTKGYLSYSDDKGRTWTIVDGVEWTGNFKVNQVIANHNKDNFVYTMGVPKTIQWNPTFYPMEIGLMRIDKNSMTDFTKYQYYAGTDQNGKPLWSHNEASWKPLDNIRSIVGASAMYHEGLDRYLYLTGLDSFGGLGGAGVFSGGLYESKTPYGKWHKVATLPTGFIASFIPKYHTNDEFYFTGATWDDDPEKGALYNLNVGKMIINTPLD